MNVKTASALAATALVSLTLGAASPASAAAPAADPAQLILTASSQVDGSLRAVSLLCGPAGGTHPDAHAACAALDAVDSDLDRLPVSERPCAQIYDPVRVTATGTYAGRLVRWDKTYGNTCELEQATGAVFRF
ncbi:SSI family serine proteinase inhibitor [Streptomyces vilmorinianum]|uniref:SSI family serine proteinase inhibitor n=1 Tax=Streptomyces vilmorinianum TaxID=3051092 RepID=UPI0010FB0EEB|nr:SSI family serine proteinase inhibitor [Streptomyces vilmorinianum]